MSPRTLAMTMIGGPLDGHRVLLQGDAASQVDGLALVVNVADRPASYVMVVADDGVTALLRHEAGGAPERAH
jgi:hypothetical protein